MGRRRVTRVERERKRSNEGDQKEEEEETRAMMQRQRQQELSTGKTLNFIPWATDCTEPRSTAWHKPGMAIHVPVRELIWLFCRADKGRDCMIKFCVVFFVFLGTTGTPALEIADYSG